MTDPDPDNMVGAAVYLEDRARGDDDRHIAALLRRAQDRSHRLELSLRNCLALACQKRSDEPEAWGHIIRFCRGAGVEPSVLRGVETGAVALETPRTVVKDLARHMGAIQKIIDAARESESNPAWPGARRCIEVARALELAHLAGESQPIEIESDVDAAERALQSISDLLGAPLEAK